MTNFFPYASPWQPEPIPPPIVLPPSSGSKLNGQRNLATRDITRKCWNCRHDRKGCKHSTNPSTCDWCIKNKYQCTEDTPPIARKRKTARFRCQQCRTRKQKCLPEERQWPEKCDECKRHNLECSEPQLPKRARPKEQQIIATPLLNNSDSTSIRMVPEGPVIEDPEFVLPVANHDLTVEMHLEVSELRSEILECSRHLGKLYGLFKAMLVAPEDSSEEYGYDYDCDHDWLLDGYIPELDNAEKLASNPVANDFPLELQRLYSSMIQGYEVMLQCDREDCLSYEEVNDYTFSNCQQILHKRIISSMTRLASVYTNADEDEAAIQVYEKAVVHISRFSGDFPASDFNSSLLDDTVKGLVALYKSQHKMLQKHLEQHADYSLRAAIPLHRAIATGVPELVSAMLDGDGVDINAEDFFRRTGLQLAAKGGFPEILETLLKHRADLNHTDNKKWTAVMYACSSGSLKCVEILYGAGADIEAVASYGDISAVTVAARFGHFEILMMLQRALGREIDYTNYALQGAVRGGHYALTRMLLDDGANPNASDRLYRCSLGNPLQNASECGHEAIVRLLLERSAKIDSSVLQIACAKGHIGVAQILLDYGANVNNEGNHGEITALMRASQTGREDLVKLLLDRGAHVNATGGGYDYGYSALQMACREGHESIVRLLLEHEADVNARGGYGPALHIVCERNLEAIAKLLVEAGADVNLRHDIGGGAGGTAFQSACREGHEGIVKLLLGRQADINAANSYGETALHLACAKGNKSIVKVLLLSNANANACDKNGGTPLHDACKSNTDESREVVKLLLVGGADPNIIGSSGTPLHLASTLGYKRIAELLLQAGAEVDKPAVGPYAYGTALASAHKEGHHDIVNLLLKHGATDVRAVTV